MTKRSYRPSARLLSDQARRRSEARWEAAADLERRTTYLTDHTGRTVHVIDWSREQIAEWRANDRAVATRKKIAASWERCPVCTTQCTLNECAAGCSIVVPDPQSEMGTSGADSDKPTSARFLIILCAILTTFVAVLTYIGNLIAHG
jgi:hypothetical protein